jgi:hypothetical protein
VEFSRPNSLLTILGYLHLAYFATEITLHRRIIRSVGAAGTTTDPYLLHIIRSAAKTRLISAMDFVNRLKPEHLQSFWYFASKVNFAIVGTFGSLLWATSGQKDEAEFYKSRLGEYRWTLRVSSKGAEFMEFAVGMLDEGMRGVRGSVESGNGGASLAASGENAPVEYLNHSAAMASAAFTHQGSGIAEQHSGLASPSTSASGSSGAYEAFMGPINGGGYGGIGAQGHEGDFDMTGMSWMGGVGEEEDEDDGAGEDFDEDDEEGMRS